jgi:hypothetical protein
VLLPKGTTFRLIPEDADSPLLVVETPQPIPLCEHQQVGMHTPVDPTVLQVPDVADYGWPTQDEWELRIKHAGAHTPIFYRNNPMNVVGWKGDLFPFKLNVRDIRPIIRTQSTLPRPHLSAAERISRVRTNDGVIPRPFPERGLPAPTYRTGTRHSRTLGRVPPLSFGATAPVQWRAFQARLGRLVQSSPASARRKRWGNA